MKSILSVIVLLSLGAAPAPPAASDHRLAASMQHKLRYIEENAKAVPPNPAPTVMTEEEINDYLASENFKLPQGVRKVTLQGRSGIVTALTMVDFDQVRAGQRSSNPLLAIFSGTHSVIVECDAAGRNGQGIVHVRSVSIDGTQVPNFALEIFVEKFLKPKYPGVGIDSVFALPNRIDTATVGYHKLTVTQK